MAEYFSGGHLRFVNGKWRDDDGNVVEISRVGHGKWLTWEEQFPGQTPRKKNNLGVFCDQCHNHADNMTDYCPNCGAKMDEEKKENE